jgi:23S rRNA (cytidine1920-2'-O)/16S rRNA (cytidine1409-2'-O)-methyltransferase
MACRQPSKSTFLMRCTEICMHAWDRGQATVDRPGERSIDDRRVVARALMTRRRLDAELTRRGLARSREHAQELVEAGSVHVRGSTAIKCTTQVSEADPITVVSRGPSWVSRGATKLLGALETWPAANVRDRRALDAGASTGGFTQVLLERGASAVVAVDVGYGQLAWPLRQDDRVTVLERTNVRYLESQSLPWRPEFVVADLSFISLTSVIAPLASLCEPGADLLVMVKPQFEVGRDQVGNGVVRAPELRIQAVRTVALHALDLGLVVRGVTPSPLPGPSGNVEYFIWMSTASGSVRDHLPNLSSPEVVLAIEDAVRGGHP